MLHGHLSVNSLVVRSSRLIVQYAFKVFACEQYASPCRNVRAKQRTSFAPASPPSPSPPKLGFPLTRIAAGDGSRATKTPFAEETRFTEYIYIYRSDNKVTLSGKNLCFTNGARGDLRCKCKRLKRKLCHFLAASITQPTAKTLQRNIFLIENPAATLPQSHKYIMLFPQRGPSPHRCKQRAKGLRASICRRQLAFP